MQSSVNRDAPNSDSRSVSQRSQTHRSDSAIDAKTQSFVHAIDLVLPAGTLQTKQDLLDAYSMLQAEIETMSNGGADRHALMNAIEQTNSLFREHGVGDIAPSSSNSALAWNFTSQTLPRELHDQYRGLKGPDETYLGDDGWWVRIGLSQLPNRLVKEKAEHLALMPVSLANIIRTRQLNSKRKFTLPESTDAEHACYWRITMPVAKAKRDYRIINSPWYW